MMVKIATILQVVFLALSPWQAAEQLEGLPATAGDAMVTAATITAGALPVAGLTMVFCAWFARVRFLEVLPAAFGIAFGGNVVAGAVTIAGWVL